MVHTSMDEALFEPTLYIVKGMCILDNDGNRILAKYYDKNILPTAKEQKAFEKNLFNKTHRANAEIIMLEGLTCVYKSNVDLFFYVMGSSHENELILQSVLQALYESISILLRRNVERRVLLDNLDAAMLAFDEICDAGVILDSDPTSIVSRAALRTEDVPLGEQTVAQARMESQRRSFYKKYINLKKDKAKIVVEPSTSQYSTNRKQKKQTDEEGYSRNSSEPKRVSKIRKASQTSLGDKTSTKKTATKPGTTLFAAADNALDEPPSPQLAETRIIPPAPLDSALVEPAPPQPTEDRTALPASLDSALVEPAPPQPAEDRTALPASLDSALVKPAPPQPAEDRTALPALLDSALVEPAPPQPSEDRTALPALLDIDLVEPAPPRLAEDRTALPAPLDSALVEPAPPQPAKDRTALPAPLDSALVEPAPPQPAEDRPASPALLDSVLVEPAPPQPAGDRTTLLAPLDSALVEPASPQPAENRSVPLSPLESVLNEPASEFLTALLDSAPNEPFYNELSYVEKITAKTRNKPSPRYRSISQKRKKPAEDKECTDYLPKTRKTSKNVVTKLRKANTLDFEGIGMAHSSSSNLNKLLVRQPVDTFHTNLDIVERDSQPVKPRIKSPAPLTYTLDEPASTQPAELYSTSLASPNNALCEYRDQEIEMCLQQIRNEDGFEVNNIIIELEEIENKDDNIIQEEGNASTSEEKKRANKQVMRYKYIDFLSDDETFEFSSSSWDESTADDSEVSDDLACTKKRKKKQQPKSKKKKSKSKNNQREKDKSEKSTEKENDNTEKETVSKIKTKRINKAKERSLLMNTGREYITKSGKVVEARTMKENPCTSNNCPNECYKIPDSRRKCIFDHYWSLSKERRRDWLIGNSKKETVKRKRCKDVESRRQFTHTYFINEGEGRKVICLKFLLKTLDVKQKFVHNTINNSLLGSSLEDQRGKKVPPNKTSPNLLQSVKNYIDNLPAVPSHYCRKNSKKFYLPQEFRNLSNLYKIYKETQQSAGNEFVGEKVFKNIFLNEYNIAFHVPRKDKCQKCIKYENNNCVELQKEKEMHLKDKQETYKRFEVHQDLKKHDDTILCTTFDLQKVLNTPYGESMLLYYSRKLAVYNLTFYESVTRQGFCYTWSENQGKRGANEVCTILAKYIENVDKRGNIKRLLLYCDSCPGQNKNKTVLACISRCLKKCNNITSIQINYLLPGHTFMPVDSMHSVIEKSTTNTIIWAPSQWPTVFELARKIPGPYSVEVLKYNDFEAWDTLGGYFKGNMVGKMSKVRIATFRKSTPDIMQVKYSMDTEAKIEEIDIVAKGDTTPKKLYKSQLPISKKKYTDLIKLCTNKIIPERYHHEYTTLQSASNVQDVLEDSDIEDIDSSL